MSHCFERALHTADNLKALSHVGLQQDAEAGGEVGGREFSRCGVEEFELEREWLEGDWLVTSTCSSESGMAILSFW